MSRSDFASLRGGRESLKGGIMQENQNQTTSQEDGTRRLSGEELKERIWIDRNGVVGDTLPDGHYKKTVKDGKVVSFVLIHSGENFPEVVKLFNDTPAAFKRPNSEKDTIHHIFNGGPNGVWLA